MKGRKLQFFPGLNTFATAFDPRWIQHNLARRGGNYEHIHGVLRNSAYRMASGFQRFACGRRIDSHPACRCNDFADLALRNRPTESRIASRSALED